jgi:flavin-dependent dehydrogenase
VLEELSPEIAATLEGRRNAGGLHVFAGRPGFMRRPFGPGWALVGDAGYFKDPLTAHGITDALRDAHLLAMAAVDGTPPAFATYAALRDALSLPFFEATEAIAGFGWDLDTLKGLHARVQQAMKREVALLAEPAPPRLPIRVSDLAAIPC